MSGPKLVGEILHMIIEILLDDLLEKFMPLRLVSKQFNALFHRLVGLGVAAVPMKIQIVVKPGYSMLLSRAI